MPNELDGPTAGERFLRGILPENPTYRQMLGMCPTLAVTGNMQAAITMALSTTFVLIAANVMTSAIRSLLAPHLRILIFTVIIASFVTVIDVLLKALMPAMSEELGAYIPLITVNCIIICRCEVCAAKQGLVTSAMDGLGQGLGFLLGLSSIAMVRELFATGGLFGVTVSEGIWPRWSIMAMAPGAFIVLGLLLGLSVWWQNRNKKKGI
jgi:electron transport complex protein RnfE